MDAKLKVACRQILLLMVFGLRLFCVNCQKYPSHQQQLQMQKFQQHIPLQQQLQTVTISIQKEFLSTDNRLQSQILQPGASFVIQDATASGGGQNQYYTDWSHINNTKTEQQKISQPQLCPGKNCKQKRSPEPQISTTESPPLTPEEQYWHGHFEDKQLRGRQRYQLPSPTQISERVGKPSITQFSERIGQAFSSSASEIIQQPSPTQVSFSTKSSDKVLQELSPSRLFERIHEPVPKTTFERSREPLAALEKEQKLFELRGKQRQDFAAEVTSGYRDKSYHRPYSQAKKESTQQMYISKDEPGIRSSSPRSPIDLKEIPKNSGDLSLNEILQQKSLYLNDLLKSKQNVLLAQQTTAAAPQKPESKSREHIGKSNRIPPISSTSTTTLTTTSEPTISDLSAEESSGQSAESQELPSGESASKESEVIKDVTTIKKNLKFLPRIRMSSTARRQQHLDATLQKRFSTTTSTTIRPSTTRFPLYNEQHHMRPSIIRTQIFNKPDSSKESSESVESQEDPSTLNHPKRSRFRPTSTTNSKFIVDQTDPALSFLEDSGENKVLLQPVDVENISFTGENHSMIAVHDQEQIETKNQEEPTTDHIHRYNSLKNYIDNNPLQAVFTDIDRADIDRVDDRTDLLELTEDRRSGNGLIKVLEQRNMSLEGLNGNRKRGSSQFHLVAFIQNRSGVFPGKKAFVNDNMDIVTAFENFPHFNLLNLGNVKPNEIKTDSQDSSFFSSLIDVKPTDEIFQDGSGPNDIVHRENSIRNPSNSNIQRQPFYTSWKSSALSSLTTSENARRFVERPDPEPPQQTWSPALQIEHEIAQAHDLVDLELSGHGFKPNAMNLIQTSQMPLGIRSAIVATAAIVLTSLMTFVVIFFACRWKQRRRHCKLDYMETYNAMKNKLPVISSRQTDELAISSTSLRVESAPSRISRNNNCQSQHHQIPIVIPIGGRYPPMTSSSTQSTKLRTMDSKSPEVQDLSV